MSWALGTDKFLSLIQVVFHERFQTAFLCTILLTFGEPVKSVGGLSRLSSYFCPFLGNSEIPPQISDKKRNLLKTVKTYFFCTFFCFLKTW